MKSDQASRRSFLKSGLLPLVFLLQGLYLLYQGFQKVGDPVYLVPELYFILAGLLLLFAFLMWRKARKA